MSSEELLEVFASDLSEKEEENQNNDWQLLKESKNQRGAKGAQPKGKAEKEDEKERREGCDTGGGRRVRVGSAPQSRKFAPTVVEPFGMTVREEERRKAQELAFAAAALTPKVERKVKTSQEEQFKAIPMPDHIKDETRCVRAKSFQLFYRDQVPTDHGEKRREESQGKRVGKGEDC